MQHNNNNVIVKALNETVASLSELQTDNTNESLAIIEQKLSHLEQLSQEMDIPELRALMHWMMLNIEFEADIDSDSENEDQINALLADGSYYSWMEVLSLLLCDYDKLLLPIVYKTLTEPKWLVKPSAPLLRNLAGWIETTRVSAETPLTDTVDRMSSEEEAAVASKMGTDEDSVSSIIDTENKHIFEEVESTVLERDYNDTNAVTHFNENSEDEGETEQLITEKTSTFYDDIEEEVIVDPTEAIFSASEEDHTRALNELLTDEVVDVDNEISDNDDSDEISIEENTVKYATSAIDESIIEALEKDTNEVLLDDEVTTNEESDDFSDEVDDIIMTLATISADSDNALKNTDQYIEELQRFEMLADISGYSQISPISNWCQQNLSLFAEAQSDNTKLFVESGECWTWIELVKLAISDPEEISTISELNAELSRDEWLEPLDVEALQGLLLFLRNPKESNEEAETVETAETEAASEETKSEESEYSFAWDEDVHPELLEVYFDETTENITEITAYFENIDTAETSKGQRQDARRIAHTIKGGSAVVGITALSTYAYQLEKILDYAIDHKLTDEANSLLQEASVCVKALFEAVKDKKAAPENFSEVLSKLMQFAN
jgi:HPt (histidine-containing phosphotransfer) domain-containing protein